MSSLENKLKVSKELLDDVDTLLVEVRQTIDQNRQRTSLLVSDMKRAVHQRTKGVHDPFIQALGARAIQRTLELTSKSVQGAT